MNHFVLTVIRTSYDEKMLYSFIRSILSYSPVLYTIAELLSVISPFELAGFCASADANLFGGSCCVQHNLFTIIICM